MRSVNANKTIYEKAADPEYRAKKPNAPMVKKRIGEGEKKYRVNPILVDIIENIKAKATKQVKQYEEQVEEWKKLLVEKDPWIEEEKFVELFNMYNFDTSKPESKDFFDFKISARLASGESQQKWKQKQDILVISQKYSSIIDETYMRVLTTKLQNQKAVIINLVNDNPLDFSYETDKICHIDKELLECLLYYRIDVIKRGNATKGNGFYGLIERKQKK